MIRAAAVVPSAPLLVPGVGGGTDPLAALRARCLDLVRGLPAPVVVLGSGPEDAWYARVPADLGPWMRGGDVAGPALSLRVGAALCAAAGVDPAGYAEVRDGVPELPANASVLVVADGSAARGDKPPAGVHPDAERWDTDLEHLLRTADTGGLQAFAPPEVLAYQGIPAIRALGRLAAGRTWTVSDVTHEAPFGVAYLTARWG